MLLKNSVKYFLLCIICLNLGVFAEQQETLEETAKKVATFKFKETKKIPEEVKAKVAKNNKVFVGTSLPLKQEGRVVASAMDMVFRKSKLDKRIVLVARDDRKSVARSLKNIRKLLHETKIFSNIFMSGLIEEVLTDIKNNEFLIFAPEENSEFLMDAQYKGLIHTKASIREELEAIIDYAVSTLKKYTFGVFFEDNILGQNGAKVAESIIKRYTNENSNIRFLAAESYPRGTVDVDLVAKKMGKIRPEVVICISRRHATYNFTLECLNQGLFRTVFLGTSYLLPIQKLLEQSRGVNFIATSVLPNPTKSKIPLIQKYRKDMKTFFPGEPYNLLSLNGYFNASILLELISRIPGKVTHEKIIEQAEALDGEIDGVKLKFNQKTRQLYNDLWISPSYKSDWISAKKRFDGGA
ncbi:ABC transporter substrate-binding protein [Candidatus Babeliales bacterium]|nr:ABC transporter substrate-binding protein [Candidatus Babeliales bacterium]